MPPTRRTLRQRHRNLSRQFPNELDFLREVRIFEAETSRRRNLAQNQRPAPYAQRQREPADIPINID